MYLLYIALGGAGGALARFGISRLVQLGSHGSFPWTTLLVNIIGSFVIGLASSYFLYVGDNILIKNFLIIGFLGAFTTFSTFSWNVLQLWQNGQIMALIQHILLNNGLSILAVFSGFFCVQFCSRFVR
jgi:CrcB protein